MRLRDALTTIALLLIVMLLWRHLGAPRKRPDDVA